MVIQMREAFLRFALLTGYILKKPPFGWFFKWCSENNCGESAEFFKIKKLLSRRWRLRVYCKRAEPEVPEEAKNNERSFFSKKNGAQYRGIAFR